MILTYLSFGPRVKVPEERGRGERVKMREEKGAMVKEWGRKQERIESAMTLQCTDVSQQKSIMITCHGEKKTRGKNRESAKVGEARGGRIER